MTTRTIKAGSVDVSAVIRIIDSADGTPETGVVFNTAGIDLEYRRELAASVDITEATLAALTTAHTDGGFLHIGNGYYRLDLPDAAVAAGVTGVLVHGTVTGMVVIGCYIELVAYDPADAVRLGLTALPNANADAAGGLPISDAGGLDLDSKLANTNEVTVARMGALTDWINGGRLDLILDIIAADTTTDIPALIAALNNLSQAQSQTAAESALQTYHLDHFIASADPGGVAANSSFLSKLVSKSATPAFSSYDNTTDSLEANRDNIGTAGAGLTAADDAVIAVIGAAGAGLTSIPDSAGVTTLLARLPAAFFAGITSLAQWLGLIAGKQVGDATARTEVRATGAGSGTYDETTDSLEAVNDIKLPALVSGRMPSDMQAISGDTVAADRLETMLDGTGGQTLSLGRLAIVNASSVAAVHISGGGFNLPAVNIGAIGTGQSSGIHVAGADSGHGLNAIGGDTGHGIRALGGATSGDGIHAEAQTLGDGMELVGVGGGVDLNSDLPWTAAWDAEVQSEVTDALNAYDPPTHAELTTGLGTADDATLAAIVALNNLSSAQVITAVTTSLTTGLTEGYRATGAIGSVRDLLYEILAGVLDHSITGTTKTIRNIGGTAQKTYTLDSAVTPTSITETT